MNKIIILLLFPLLLSFKADPFPFKDGKYINDSEMMYAVEIFNEGTEIRLYMQQDENDKSHDYKTFISGTIGRVKRKYFVQHLDGTHISKRRQKELEIKIRDGKIVFNTYCVLNDFYDQFKAQSDELNYEFKGN
jgi:hypothetical protein